MRPGLHRNRQGLLLGTGAVSTVPDGVLLLGFGGPRTPEDVGPFLSEVLEGKPVPPERRNQVARQYACIGGASPYVPHLEAQGKALEALLLARGLPLPVSCAFLYADPRPPAALAWARRLGLRRLFSIVMAPHQSPVSFDRYVRALEGSCAPGDPQVLFAPDWHLRPGFLKALADRTKEALLEIPESLRPNAEVIFTAHSLPESIAMSCRYAADVKETARLVAERLGLRRWHVAWQSRSGRPEDPWLSPDVGDLLEARGREGLRAAVVVPAGFLVDHAEVLFDLDVRAKSMAKEASVAFARARTVGDHPAFIAALASLVEETAAAEPFRERRTR